MFMSITEDDMVTTGFLRGHGKPVKSWNFEKSFSRLGKSWNLGYGK